jgi:putative FmdB family regulatory protein
MPVYEFECECGHVFEELVPVGTCSYRCPRCNKSETRKIMSACTFELKGGGWYADGYASNKK